MSCYLQSLPRIPEIQDEGEYISTHNCYLIQDKEIITNINIPMDAVLSDA